MNTEIVNKKELSADSPLFKDLVCEIMKQKETIQKREELSEQSFRVWLCKAIEIIAGKMGYVIQNLKEIMLDFAYSFEKGFAAGRERAKMNSFRKSDK